jgi:glycosyltransferase involved in cell wall biosynthesis
MKIGFDAKRAFSNTAGLGNFSRNSIIALTKQFPDNQYYLFNPGNRKPLFIAPQSSMELKPENILWKTFSFVWRSMHISKITKKLQLDIYHGLSHELPMGIEKTKTKSIVTIHDVIFLRYPEFYKKIDREIYDKKFRHACRIATRIHSISDQTKLDLIEYYGVPEEKITVIYQSINPIFFQKVDPDFKFELRKKHQLPKKFLLSVGTVESRKNLLGLLEGMVASKVYVPLVVVGKSTDYMQKVQKFIEADLNRLQVYFLPRISDDELVALYQMAEVMVYPSFFEGFGLPVAEAQASGCPVITSNISSLPEAGGDAALYVDPAKPEEIGEALKTVLSDSSLRKSMIDKGKANAHRFTHYSYAVQMEQLYKTVLNE